MRKFEYVPLKEVKNRRSYCSDKINRLKQYLCNSGYAADFELIGSGSRNLVTRIEGQGFDLDYNLIINDNIDSLREQELKNDVMSFLNKVKSDKAQTSFRNCQDSTSAITARLIVKGKLLFHFDVAILAKNGKGNYCRLIHEKTGGTGRYSWTEVPYSGDVFKKFGDLKRYGYFQNIRELYLKKKNMYLERNQLSTHPSFVVFVETVNEIYNQYSFFGCFLTPSSEFDRKRFVLPTSGL